MRVLILGGTSDGSRLAAMISQREELEGVELLTSLAGRTQNPNLGTNQIRIGGFGGVAGLVDYINSMSIDIIIDATHPFATQISNNGLRAAKIANIPHLMVVRPGWERQPEDNWIEVESLDIAVQAIAKIGQRVFLTIGRQEIGKFAEIEHIWFLMRMIDPPNDGKIPRGEILLERGPFTLESDRQLMINYRIDHLISKNSGGNATYSKIIAARELGIPVVMVRRSQLPQCLQVGDIEGAVEWLIRQNKSS